MKTLLYLGGGFSNISSFSPLCGQDEAILTSLFFKWGGEKPPTTLPKIAPENRSLEKEIPIGNHRF